MTRISSTRIPHHLLAARRARIIVVGDIMLDQFMWGNVSRISPEAPVPIVELCRESFMPGGAANVARNLSSLGASAELVSIVGRDESGRQLCQLLQEQNVECAAVLTHPTRPTSIKMRIVAHQQQIVRVDRESREELDDQTARRLLSALAPRLDGAAGVIVGDYGKGVVSQDLLDSIKRLCRKRGV